NIYALCPTPHSVSRPQTAVSLAALLHHLTKVRETTSTSESRSALASRVCSHPCFYEIFCLYANGPFRRRSRSYFPGESESFGRVSDSSQLGDGEGLCSPTCRAKVSAKTLLSGPTSFKIRL